MGRLEGASSMTISRGELFSMAGSLDSDRDVLRLLWHVLAWGSGSRLRLNRRRLDGISKAPGAAAAALRDAARLSRTDPEAAYRCLSPGTGTPLPYLGPAFFTKYLYFAGAGAPDHPCLIIDSRVAHALNTRCGWTTLRSGGNWPPETYQRYCTLLARWAREESDRSGRQVCADQIERWLFEP